MRKFLNAGRVRSAFFVKKILLSGRWPEREGLRRLMIVREYERKDFMIDFKVVRKEMEWGGRKLVLETGKLARQAQGAVVVTYGETEVIATVCAAKEAKADQDFFPLTVNYQEKYYATGKVPGGFMKREGKPSEREVLLSRLIDRPIRPLFPDAFKNEVQVICTVLSHDQNTDSDIPAMIAASAALSISGTASSTIASCRSIASCTSSSPTTLNFAIVAAPFRFRKINQRQLCKFSVPVRVRPKDAIPFPARNGIFHDLLFLILEGMHVEF